MSVVQPLCPNSLQCRSVVEAGLVWSGCIHSASRRRQRTAIRLFTERDSDGDWIRGYDLRPSLLLYGTKDQPLIGYKLAASLSRLKDEVAPVLNDPMDARYIVPGLVDGVAGRHPRRVRAWLESH